MTHDNPERSVRLAKLHQLTAAGVHPYPERYERTHSLEAIRALPVGTPVRGAGRLMTMREMGKICFCHIQDQSGKIQVVLKKDTLGEATYALFTKNLDRGDFIGAAGEVFVTKTGEVSILASEVTFLGKALLPPPEKFHGVQDQETIYRQRYLDLIASRQTMGRFLFRSRFIQAIREFYWREGFLEVETPVLMHKATGAAARPYHTHNNALDIDVVLRISVELPLKELVVGGFEKIFEIGKAFRNEGHDPSHLPEHTHFEHYVAYWNCEDNIRFTERLFDHLFTAFALDKKRAVRGKDGSERIVDFTTPWQRIDFVSLVSKDSGLDIASYRDADTLRRDLAKRGIEFEGMADMGLATLVDNIYKKVSRPNLINPTILYNYPKFIQPLARVNDKNSEMVDQFQLVVNGWEIVKAYSELVDPIDQRERFLEQARSKEAGDEEAYELDEEYLTAMEHGMPPISGWGMGLDRLLCLLTGQENVRDVVLFPLVRPRDASVTATDAPAVTQD